MADNKAAFGVFPQMKPRRSKQDREAAKNVPVDLARGFVAGALGMPGDIESLARLPYELITGKESPTILPTSEDIEKRLPFKSDSPVSQAATGLGQIGGGFYTGPLSGARAVASIPGALRHGAQEFVAAAGQSGPRIFIGPKAKTFNQIKADRAKAMEKQGADPIDIWRETGTFKGADGIWRQEISDQTAKFLTPEDRALRIAENKLAIDKIKQQVAPTSQKDLFPKALTEAKKEAREEMSILRGENKMRERNPRTQGLNAEYIFEHPELYAAYPELRNVRVTTEGGSGSTKGALNIIPSRGQLPGVIEMDIYDKALRSDPASTTLHEMQHAVQTLEGMHPGGNPTFAFSDPITTEIYNKKLADLMKPSTFEEFQRANRFPEDKAQQAYEEYVKTYKPSISSSLKRELQSDAAFEYYRRLGGEAEARAAQERQMMSPSQRRQEFPYSSYDISPEDIIVKPPREFKDGGEAGMAGGGLFKNAAKKAIGNAAEAAGMKAPVVAEKDLTTLQDFHTSLGDRIHAGAEEARKMMEGFDYQYDKGQRVFTKDSAAKNRPPYTIIERTRVGNAPMREDMDNPLSKKIIDPKTGKVKRTPYEPGYRVRMENGPEDTWYEFVLPASAILGDVGMKRGGSVHISDNLDAMMMDVEDRKMAVGGLLRRGAKAAKSEPALPLELPRAPAKTKEEIRPVAQRMAQQMTDEFVRPNPKKSINPAGKSFKQFKMEQDLTHDIRPAQGVTLSPQQVANIENQLGMLKIGVSGDTTIADQVLHRAGPYQLDLPSPQHGGPLYALGGEGAWASNNPTAATFQKRVQELSRAHGDAPTLGQFVAMGPEGSNFALHLADANLRAIDLSKMTKRQIEQVNNIIRQGTEKSGPRPGFPGIEDKDSAYLHFAFDPELRKAFNAMMNKPDYTSKLNLPDGRVILHAVTEPELRNTEILTSGRSQMMLDPSVAPEALALSGHPTYSHVIPKVPGSEVSQTRYPIPAELEFPDVFEFVKQNYRPRDITRVYQTGTPRQIVDPQHIDEMKMYEELMREYTGKKEGGAVRKAAQIDGNKFVLAAQKYGLKDDISTLNKLVSLVNQGATVDEAARVVAESVEMAGGGLPMVKAGLKEMMERIANRFGGYEAKRLERAADEVPNLESLYEPQSLERLFSGDNAKGIMTMRPEDFEKYSTKLPFDPRAKKQFVFDPEMDEKFPMGISQEDYIKYLANLKGFSDVPYLEVNTTPARLKPAPFITGHEGRHRNRAMVLSGQSTGIVQFAPRAELREPMPRRSREEYLQALNEELERTNRMVRPQKIDPKDKPRPLVQLPPVYKDGGEVNSGLIKVQKKRKVRD